MVWGKERFEVQDGFIRGQERGPGLHTSRPSHMVVSSRPRPRPWPWPPPRPRPPVLELHTCAVWAAPGWELPALVRPVHPSEWPRMEGGAAVGWVCASGKVSGLAVSPSIGEGPRRLSLGFVIVDFCHLIIPIARRIKVKNIIKFRKLTFAY